MTNKSKKKIEIEDVVILIRINKTYKEDMSKEELYEATRKDWVLNPERVNGVKYAFSVYKGIVKEVYEVDNWKLSFNESKEKNRMKRYAFSGKIANKNIRIKYLDMSIVKYLKRGHQSPIIYINC